MKMKRSVKATAVAALASASVLLASGGNAGLAAVIGKPAPVTAYVTTYTNEDGSAAATVALRPQQGAVFTWQLQDQTGHVVNGHTANPMLHWSRLMHDWAYRVREKATGSAWSAWTKFDTKTCAGNGGSQYFDPALVARTTVVDGASWMQALRYTGGAFSDSLQYTFQCEADSTFTSDWWVVQYVNGTSHFNAPLPVQWDVAHTTRVGLVGIWHLAAP